MTLAPLILALGGEVLPLLSVFSAVLGVHLHAALPPPTASVEAAVLAAATAA
jgi:hypothetical protein